MTLRFGIVRNKITDARNWPQAWCLWDYYYYIVRSVFALIMKEKKPKTVIVVPRLTIFRIH